MSIELVAFVVAAIALLGSPGPGIAALVAVGRSFQRGAALRFYGMMQLGLAIAAGISALGLAGLLAASPLLQSALLLVATAYLLWLAWAIASAPVAGELVGEPVGGSFTSKGAFLLGVANSKAYLAFASLMGSFTLAPAGEESFDVLLKWGLCVAVMVVVDLAWLGLGALFGKIALKPAAERAFNIAMGLTIVAACGAAWL